MVTDTCDFCDCSFDVFDCEITTIKGTKCVICPRCGHAYDYDDDNDENTDCVAI